jgi:flagellar biosynthetic protein FliS
MAGPLAREAALRSGYASACYRETRARTTTAAELVFEVHEAALRDLLDASGAPRCDASLLHAHGLIAELQAGLDPSADPELCAQFSTVYDFALTRIIAAYVAADATLLAPVIDALRQLRGAWLHVLPVH